jgi:transposase InsO family protein
MSKSDYLEEKLGDNNFVVWDTMFRALLARKELLQSGLRAPAKIIIADGKEDDVWSLLIFNVNKQYLSVVRKASTATLALESLRNLHVSRTAARQLQLQEDFTTLRMKNSESISAFISRGEELAQLMTDAGIQPATATFLRVLLSGLPKEYRLVKKIIIGKMTPHTSLEEIRRDLLLEEQELKCDRECDKAKALSTQAKKGQRSDRRLVNRSKETRRCHHCGKRGHLIADCREKAAEQKRQGAVMMASHAQNSADWILDSGASHHMICSKEAFVSLNNLDVPINLEIANGDIMHVTQSGDAKVLVSTGDKSYEEILLTNALYAPNARHNLVSVLRATEHGVNVFFSDHSCTLKQNGKIVALAVKSYGLYKLLAPRQGKILSVSDMQQAFLWHRRLAHVNAMDLAKLVSQEMATGVSITAQGASSLKTYVCEPCIYGKHARKPFPSSTSETTSVLELVHSDLAGPMQVKSLVGAYYFVTYLDDFSGYSFVRMLRTKSEVEDTTKALIQFLETQTGKLVKKFQNDNGGEYVNEVLKDYFAQKGIVHRKTVPHTPQQNGKAERLNRTLLDKARTMRAGTGLPTNVWAEAVNTANYLRNRLPTSGRFKTPYELFWGSKPDLSHVRVFGAVAYSHIHASNRRKLDNRAETGIMVGYSETSKAYRILHGGKIAVSRDVTFDETCRCTTSAIRTERSVRDPGTNVQESDSDNDLKSVETPLTHNCDTIEVSNKSSESSEQEQENTPMPTEAEHLASGQEDSISSPEELVAENDPGDSGLETQTHQGWKSMRARKVPNYKGMLVSGVNVEEPTTYKEAVDSLQSSMWKQAMNEELQSLHEYRTWTLETPPKGTVTIPCKWVYKVKTDARGNIERFKARIVAKGFKQRPGIDFDQVWAPVSKHSSLRTLLAIVADKNLELDQLDVKTAFLNGDLEEELWMDQPEGYVQGSQQIKCRLHKALYGLKQAPRAWFAKLRAVLNSLHLHPSEADAGLYTAKHPNGEILVVLVYVDDILLAGSKHVIAHVKSQLKTKFDIKDLGAAGYFLGMEICRERSKGKIILSQVKYTREILERFRLDSDNVKAKRLPISRSDKFIAEGEALDTNVYEYSSMVGALNYLAGCTRPDIAFAVGVLGRFAAKPTTDHWTLGKGVLRYLKGTLNLGITFGAGKPKLSGYCDADFAGDSATRRSTTGYAFVLNGGIISHCSRLQRTIAASTQEAEYQAMSEATREALALRKLMKDLGYPMCTIPIRIKTDSTTALSLAENPIQGKRSKHIDLAHHIVRERVARKEVVFEYVPTAKMWADFLTKAVTEDIFMKCKEGLGISSI